LTLPLYFIRNFVRVFNDGLAQTFIELKRETALLDGEKKSQSEGDADLEFEGDHGCLIKPCLFEEGDV